MIAQPIRAPMLAAVIRRGRMIQKLEATFEAANFASASASLML
jgi:hypothetical protein